MILPLQLKISGCNHLLRLEVYGWASVAELKRPKELEAENVKLKCMYADLAPENVAIKDLLSRKL